MFKYRTNTSAQWTQVNVSLSPILASRISQRKTWDKLPVNVPYAKHEFTSTLTSPEYSDSPFRLVFFKKTQHTDVDDNYHLEAVDEWGAEVYDETLGEVIGYKNGWRKAKDYIRHEVRKINKMLADMQEGTVIVPPQLKRVAIK